ncbi:uncharacterized protein LOC144144349 isoform X2 [Haemaphysalis longicornis]
MGRKSNANAIGLLKGNACGYIRGARCSCADSVVGHKQVNPERSRLETIVFCAVSFWMRRWHQSQRADSRNYGRSC